MARRRYGDTASRQTGGLREILGYLAMTLMAAALVVLGVGTAARDLWRYLASVPVAMHITDVEGGAAGDDFVRIDYRYTVDGKDYTGSLHVEEHKPCYDRVHDLKVGQRHTGAMDPARPDEAVLVQCPDLMPLVAIGFASPLLIMMLNLLAISVRGRPLVQSATTGEGGPPLPGGIAFLPVIMLGAFGSGGLAMLVHDWPYPRSALVLAVHILIVLPASYFITRRIVRPPHRDPREPVSPEAAVAATLPPLAEGMVMATIMAAFFTAIAVLLTGGLVLAAMEGLRTREVAPQSWFAVLFTQPFVIAAAGLCSWLIGMPLARRRLLRFLVQPADPPWHVPGWGVMEREGGALVLRRRLLIRHFLIAFAVPYAIVSSVMLIIAAVVFLPFGFSVVHLVVIVAVAGAWGLALAARYAGGCRSSVSIDPLTRELSVRSPRREHRLRFDQIRSWRLRDVLYPYGIVSNGSQQWYLLLEVVPTDGPAVPVHRFHQTVGPFGEETRRVARRTMEVLAGMTGGEVCEHTVVSQPRGRPPSRRNPFSLIAHVIELAWRSSHPENHGDLQ